MSIVILGGDHEASMPVEPNPNLGTFWKNTAGDEEVIRLGSGKRGIQLMLLVAVIIVALWSFKIGLRLTVEFIATVFGFILYA